MLPTRCETSATFCAPLVSDAVAAVATFSPPSSMRSNRRPTPSGKPVIVSTGWTSMLTVDVTGRAIALPAASANSFVLLMSSMLPDRDDLLDPDLEHVDAVGVKRAEIGADREPGEEALDRHAVVHGEAGSLEELRGDQILGLQHGLGLEAGLGAHDRARREERQECKGRDGGFHVVCSPC